MQKYLIIPFLLFFTCGGSQDSIDGVESSSNNIDTTVSNTYRDAIIYGTLYRLLRMPNREWSDVGSAQEYLFQFTQEIQQAELRARGGDLGVKRTVKYKGIGMPRRRYGKYGKEIDY